MTDRERWTVYPLLFLAMGMAMRDNIFELVDVDKVQCKALLCNTLVVTDQKGQQQVVVSSNESGGIVQTAGNSGRPDVIVGHSSRVSGLLFVNPRGTLLPGSIFAPAVAPPQRQSDDDPDSKTDGEAESAEPQP